MNAELQKLANALSRTPRSGRLISPADLPTEIDWGEVDPEHDSDELRRILTLVKFPSARSFHLRTIETGLALMQSSADHRCVRRKGGTHWSLFVSGPDLPLGEEEIRLLDSFLIISEVQDLGCELILGDWIKMGWRPA